MRKRRSKYNRYIASETWKEVRRKAIELAGGKCSDCGSSGSLCGHHINYPNDLYMTTEEDVQVLCETCHNELHREIHRRKNDRSGAEGELAKLRARQKHAVERFNEVGGHTQPLLQNQGEEGE